MIRSVRQAGDHPGELRPALLDAGVGGVADHAVLALTNDSGEFELPSVPPGKYTFADLAGSLGISSREVTVGANGPATRRAQGATVIFFDASHAAECVGSASAEHPPFVERDGEGTFGARNGMQVTRAILGVSL